MQMGQDKVKNFLVSWSEKEQFTKDARLGFSFHSKSKISNPETKMMQIYVIILIFSLVKIVIIES